MVELGTKRQISKHLRRMASEERSSVRSSAEKVPRKVIVAARKLEGRFEGARILEVKKKRSKKLQSRGSENGDAFEDNAYEKSIKAASREKRDLKLKQGNDRLGSGINGNCDRKRKRIYADHGTGACRAQGGNAKRQEGKSVREVEKRKLSSSFDKEKKVLRGIGISEKSLLFGRTKSKSGESLDQKNLMAETKRAGTVNDPHNTNLGNMIVKTRNKRNVPMTAETHPSKNNLDSEHRYYKRRAKGKQNLDIDIESKEDLPKKKKRVIRLDPHDISNKRLNDDVANRGNKKEEKQSQNIDIEISKNAKFRAILPSPSILSFVEENLLGRRRDIEFRRCGYNTELSAPLDNIPLSTSSERERIEIPVFRNKLEFFAAAKISSSFPAPEYPEIAFAGRSNVGKSSLLNALTRQWGVVRTSDKPGLTQTINFFKLGSKLSLVDLPGYGFAYAKDEVKEAWEELVKEYVAARINLKRVCLLIDTKWGMKPRDHELIDLMERYQTKYQIVLTKTDLVFPITVARRAMEIEESLKAKKSAIQPLMMVSSTTGAGIRSLRTVLGSIARFAKR